MSLNTDQLQLLHTLVLPDSWQSEAIQKLREGRDVILDAPTGAGKTYVFEKWHERQGGTRRSFYAVPTRALANDKYAEWRAKGWRVGLVTGDASLHPESPLVVGTLEALRGLLHRGQQVDLFAIDEYQWLGDAQRGNHYEGVIMALPPETQLLMMSGCVSNPKDLSHWLRRLGRGVDVVSHTIRPVPLEEVDSDHLAKRIPTGIEGFWSKRLAGALREDLGPILVFAPHRREAERLARQAARELPPSAPLQLSAEQKRLLGPELSPLLEQRIAFHHSGLNFGQRAGVIEPLAKAGQLRVVVATLGLSAGINFSLRSVMITGRAYHVQGVEHPIQPHELLQMIGRAGRRGLDSVGYYLSSRETPRMLEAHPMRLQRSSSLPWSMVLERLTHSEDPVQTARTLAKSFYSKQVLPLGVEVTTAELQSLLPCGLATDTARARLIRRRNRPFKACRTCEQSAECRQLDPGPTLLWQWGRLQLLDAKLRLTRRGRLVSFFLGPEGLALAAALETPDYPLQELIFDLANLYAGERFCGNEPRWSGRLALACQKTYGRFSVDNYLLWGVPPNYGTGASELVKDVLNKNRRKSQLTGEHSGVGDIDRLLTEWRSLLRQIKQAPDLSPSWPRWDELRQEASQWLTFQGEISLPEIPPLTPSQREPHNHRIRWI
ncbi:MAG: DEAD/DEAH box helicase [Blastochloris sp.]|nr:DEAD/DEAH box helicase [Blastochloris sp.]